ncbi:M48 family metalloprotease [Undibacterium fentianense]|nr:M48 family metalloprotease [Undibacterium fentianense]
MKKEFPKFRFKLIQLTISMCFGSTLLLPHLGYAQTGTISTLPSTPPSTTQNTPKNQSLPTLGDAARGDLSPIMERKIGEQIMSSVRRDPDYLEDGPVIEYLTKLGNSLLDKRPDARGEESYEFEFFAVRDPVLNAFAFPGGFLGFHSGLILAAQSESELASVMGHEIGHVSQRHIARMLGNQKNDFLIPIAAIILAALAARTSPDAAMGMIMGGQGLAIQRQLNFSRDAEREADRIGFQILKDGGYDTAGMLAFFGRMQHASRNYTDNGLSYLRSHPLTSERMADIQGRLFGERYRQRVDGLDFYLTQARVRVLQDSKAQGLIDAAVAFENQIKNGNEERRLSGEYGLAFIAYKKNDFLKAEKLLDTLVAHIAQMPNQKKWLKETSAFASLAIDIEMGKKRPDLAVAKAKAALRDLPLARGLAHQYAEVLIEAKNYKEAEAFLRDQISLYRREAKLQHLLAKSYAAEGKQALQHIALAEAYALEGALPAALAQLDIARLDPDVKYYDLSVIDAREREWKEKRKEELEDEKKGK